MFNTKCSCQDYTKVSLLYTLRLAYSVSKASEGSGGIHDKRSEVRIYEKRMAIATALQRNSICDINDGSKKAKNS
jgi:hypothetical protein